MNVLVVITAITSPRVVITVTARRLVKIGVVFLYQRLARSRLLRLSSAQLAKAIIISIIIISPETNVVTATVNIIIIVLNYITLRRSAIKSVTIINILILIFLPLFPNVPIYLLPPPPPHQLLYSRQLSITV